MLTVATGRNSEDEMRRFLSEVGAENLPLLVDPRQSLASALGVLSLPVTILLDAEGREVARLSGAAEWDSPEVVAALDALAAGG